MSYEIDRLTDTADIAEQEIQRELDRALNLHNNKKRMQPNGKCWDCGSLIEDNLLFCDKECRDEYEWYNGKIGG